MEQQKEGVSWVTNFDLEVLDSLDEKKTTYVLVVPITTFLGYSVSKIVIKTENIITELILNP